MRSELLPLTLEEVKFTKYSFGMLTRSSVHVPDFIALDKEALQAQLLSRGFAAGQAAFVLRAVHRQLVQCGLQSIPELSGLNQKLAGQLVDHLHQRWPKLLKEEISDDGSRKWLLQFSGDVSVETVFIPEARRGTLCLSSQAGCSTQCRFCHTGTLGLKRNLSAEEIVLQVLFARRALRQSLGSDPASNIVMMGMGEPLLNWPAVSQALRAIAAGLGLARDSRRLSISTVGVLPQLLHVQQELGCNLVLSLHAANDRLRDELIPLNRQYPLASLHAALQKMQQPGRDYTIAYLLLDGVNDSDDDARQLIDWVQGLAVRVNLLPLNPWPGCPFRPASAARMQAFHALLLKAGLNTHTRRSRGQDIAAACGQLAKR